MTHSNPSSSAWRRFQAVQTPRTPTGANPTDTSTSSKEIHKSILINEVRSNLEAASTSKKKDTPETVIVGGVTYQRKQEKIRKPASTTVISFRLKNEQVDELDKYREFNGRNADRTPSRAEVVKQALNYLLVSKTNP